MSIPLLDALKRSAAVPSMPQVATRFLEIMQKPDFDYKELISVLSTDPGTASEILRLTNSSLFGVVRQITSLDQAMAMLGVRRLRSIVLGRYAVETMNACKSRVIDTSYYWRRSVATAVLASRFAEIDTPRQRDEAFIAGLLADVGVMVLDAAMPDRYRPLAEQYRPLGKDQITVAEKTLLGVTHAEVSAAVLEHWQLPELVCDAVCHHADEPTINKAPTLATVVGAADAIGKYLSENPKDMERVVEVCRREAARVGLGAQGLVELVGDIEKQIEELASMLRVDIIPSKVYDLIARAITEHLVPA